MTKRVIDKYGTEIVQGQSVAYAGSKGKYEVGQVFLGEVTYVAPLMVTIKGQGGRSIYRAPETVIAVPVPKEVKHNGNV